MFKNSFSKKMFMCVLCFTRMMHAIDLAQFGKICAGVGVALVTAGAAAVGVDWLINPTNEQLINRVRQDFDTIIKNDTEYVLLFKRSFYWDRYSQSVRYEVMNSFSEPFLYDIARLSDNISGQPFPSTVTQDCAILERHVKKLLQRIDELQMQKFLTDQERYYLSTMHQLLEQALVLQDELCLLKDYLVKHASYFVLAETGWSINKKYSAEFELCELYTYDQYRLLQRLDSLIYKKYNYSTFAYISYVEDIESTLSSLLYVRNRAAFNYSGMISWVDQCIDQLRFIRAMVESRYKLQLLERERMYFDQKNSIF